MTADTRTAAPHVRTGVIDSHLHVWDLTRAEYDWLGPEAGELNRTIHLSEVAPELEAAGVAGVVLVQSADNDEDTDHMLDVAAQEPIVRGVVGFVPLHNPERAAERITELLRNPVFCGIRNLIHNRPDPLWLLREEVDVGLGILEDAGIPFDVIGTQPKHLEAALRVSERHPNLNLVIDHLCGPPIGSPNWEPWASLIAAVATNPRAYGKLSGLYATGANPSAWTVDAVRPVLDHALEAFGPSRLMYGGDWPIALNAGGYRRVWTGITELLADLAAADRDQILASTARTFYSLDDGRSCGRS